MGLGQEGTELTCACYCPSVGYLGVGVVFGMGQRGEEEWEFTMNDSDENNDNMGYRSNKIPDPFTLAIIHFTRSLLLRSIHGYVSLGSQYLISIVKAIQESCPGMYNRLVIFCGLCSAVSTVIVTPYHYLPLCLPSPMPAPCSPRSVA